MKTKGLAEKSAKPFMFYDAFFRNLLRDRRFVLCLESGETENVWGGKLITVSFNLCLECSR